MGRSLEKICDEADTEKCPWQNLGGGCGVTPVQTEPMRQQRGSSHPSTEGMSHIFRKLRAMLPGTHPW